MSHSEVNLNDPSFASEKVKKQGDPFWLWNWGQKSKWSPKQGYWLTNKRTAALQKKFKWIWPTCLGSIWAAPCCLVLILHPADLLTLVPTPTDSCWTFQCAKLYLYWISNNEGLINDIFTNSNQSLEFKCLKQTLRPIPIKWIQYPKGIGVINIIVTIRMFSAVSVCMSVCVSVCLCVCLSVFLSVQAITFELLDIETSFFGVQVHLDHV